MQIATHQFADSFVAAPSGRIDHNSAAALEVALLPSLAKVAEQRGTLVVDLSGVEYISSVGLRVLMIAAKQSRAQGTKLAVAALQSVVAEIFTISRFDKVLTVCATVDEALGSDAARVAYRARGAKS